MTNTDSLITLIRTLYINSNSYLLKRENRWKAVSIVLFFLIFTIYGSMRATFIKASDLRNGYLIPTRAVLYQGKDIYQDVAKNSFPAFFYCIIAFFAQFQNGVASILWSLLNIFLYLVINAIIIHIMRLSWPHLKNVSYFIGPILTAPLLADVLFLGQSDIMTLFFICVSLFYYLHNKDITSGIWLAAGICFKVTPGLFIIYYLLKARFRILLGTLIGIILFFLIIPSLYFGPVKSINYAKDWSSMILEPFLKGKKVKSTNLTWKHSNQSLEAFLHRHFTGYGERKYKGFHKQLSSLQISKETVNRLSKIIKVCIFILLIAATKIAKSSDLRRIPYEVSLFLMAMLYLSPISWISHYMLILVPYCIMANTIVNLPKENSGRKFLIYLLWIAMFFSVFNQTPYLQSFSLLFIGNFILFVGLIIYVFFFLSNKSNVIMQAT